MQNKLIYTFTLGKIHFAYYSIKETLRTMQVLDKLKTPYLLDVRVQKRGKHGRKE